MLKVSFKAYKGAFSDLLQCPIVNDFGPDSLSVGLLASSMVDKYGLMWMGLTRMLKTIL